MFKVKLLYNLLAHFLFCFVMLAASADAPDFFSIYWRSILADGFVNGTRVFILADFCSDDVSVNYQFVDAVPQNGFK